MTLHPKYQDSNRSAGTLVAAYIVAVERYYPAAGGGGDGDGAAGVSDSRILLQQLQQLL